MATSVWRGNLTFGLVSIPVRLFKAARPQRVHFHQLRRSAPKPPETVENQPESSPRSGRAVNVRPPEPEPEPDYSRIRQTAYVPKADANAQEVQLVPRSDLVKGYEYSKDRYVVLDEEDLKRITPQTATEMQILEFIRREQIDPIYFETSYYLAPDEAGAKTYALLFEAMKDSRHVALAEVAMHRREHILILRPGTHGIVTHTMYYPDEIRGDLEYRADASQVSPKEMELALMLIKTLEAPFDPGKYRDKFREHIEATIAAKLKGRQVIEAPSIHRPAEAVSILDVLQKSLAQARKPATSETKPNARAKKSHR